MDAGQGIGRLAARRPSPAARAVAPPARTRSPSRVGATPARLASLRRERPGALVATSASRARERPHRVEQVLGGRHPEQCQHRPATGGLPRDRDPRRVAAERAMLSRTHSSAASQSRTPRFDGAPGDVAEAVEAEPVRDGDGHDAVAVERASVVPGARGRAGDVAAAVDVDEHREGGIRVSRQPA